MVKISEARARSDQLVREKLRQATELLSAAGVEAWLIVSPNGDDPAMPLVVGGSHVSQRGFFLITASGKHYAAVSSVDMDEFTRTGGYGTILPFVEDQRQVLGELLIQAEIGEGTLALDDDPHDHAWGGLGYGRFRWLQDILSDVGHRGELVSARDALAPLRSVKAPEELGRVRRAAEITNLVVDEVKRDLRVGLSEEVIQGMFLEAIDRHGVEPTAEGPIVGYGGAGYTTHHEASGRQGTVGDQLMADLGVMFEGFTSDISRTFYFLRPGEGQPPSHLRRLFGVHREAMDRALAFMKPGILGWQVDQVARQVVRDAGYPEFEHALGHQIGRLPHDGGTLLAPRWERYGDMPYGALLEGEIYTLEPTLITSEGYVCQVEEEVLVTATGSQVLTRRQDEIFCIGR